MDVFQSDLTATDSSASQDVSGYFLSIFLYCIAGYQHRHHLQIPERTSRSPSYPLLRSPSTNRFSSSRYQIRSSDSEPTISLCRIQSSKGRNIFKDIFWNNFQILQTSLVLNQTIFYRISPALSWPQPAEMRSVRGVWPVVFHLISHWDPPSWSSCQDTPHLH